MKMDVNRRETKCHICDLKFENLDYHIFTFHAIHGVQTEKIDVKCKLGCFVKIQRLKIQSIKILQLNENIPENKKVSERKDKTHVRDEKCKWNCFVKIQRVKIQNKKVIEPKENIPENEKVSHRKKETHVYNDFLHLLYV